MKDWTDIANTFKINHKLADDRRVRIAKGIVVGKQFELGKVCSRCGGGGHYSFNQQTGTVCFGCDGAGYTVPRINKKLIAAIDAKIEDGAIDRHWDNVRIAKRLKKLQDEVMDVWKSSGIAALYNEGYKVGGDALMDSEGNRTPLFNVNNMFSTTFSRMGNAVTKIQFDKEMNNSNRIEAINDLVEKWEGWKIEMEARAAKFIATHKH